ncbi:tail fiber domain-containing protein [Puia dinghuensis]|uniref:Peptidase S74 domain-containing protein n=1 Tax=Puia dinghuensis TaxID=1792502 RepID=A0A8J2XT87_9BACT|nr:tail fiber domain-containing protein [Puia dinghuensis]GGA97063.1 hypothetical protein GCM10011511_20470 [Puia dinghuensis]
MKKTPFLVAVLCLSVTLRMQAQNVGIGTTHPLQKLHVAGGLRVDTLSNGKDSGLLRHNADGTVFSLRFTGDSTQVLRANGTFGTPAIIINSSLTDPWLVGGNAGIVPAINFLGTTDNNALRLRINNQWAGQLDSVSQSTFFGYGAGKYDTAAGAGNTAYGYQAMNVVTYGVYNTATGVRALLNNSSGYYNTATGWQAMLQNTYGSLNTAFGVQALQNNTSGVSNTAVGLNSLNINSSGSNNTAVGVQALNWNSQGNYNIGIGRSAAYGNTTGNNNIAIGHQALMTNQTGYNNISIGTGALQKNLGSADEIAIGDSALFTESGGNTQNTALGTKAMFNNTSGSYNTALGAWGLYANTTGSYNCSVGGALANSTTGNSNVGVGITALVSNSTGSNNAAVGYNAIGINSTGNNNSALGYYALGTNVSGTNNTAVGSGADVTAENLTNATALGAGALVDASNKVRIGNSSVTVIEGQVLPTTPSDGRFKFNIKQDIKGLDFILRLRPVSYQFDVRKFAEQSKGGTFARYTGYDQAMALRRTGFIAQEVEKAAEDAGYEFTGVEKPKSATDHYSLSYEAFIMPMVKAIQEQQQQIEELKKIVAEQRRLIDQFIHHQ